MRKICCIKKGIEKTCKIVQQARPKTTWGRELETDMNNIGGAWQTLQGMAADRKAWCELVGGLCIIVGIKCSRSRHYIVAKVTNRSKMPCHGILKIQ